MKSKLMTGLEGLILSDEIAGISIAAVKDGEIVFNGAVGKSKIDSKGGKDLNIDDKFRIASISKLITTIGFMKLVETDKISLDDNINDYLDFELINPNYLESIITPKMLLSHTSSIRDGSYYTAPMPYTMKDFFLEKGDYYEDGNHYASGAKKEPGKYFTYANLNFGIIASIIETISGKRFDIYMREEVFEPLGIQASYNVRDFGKDIDKVGVLYRKIQGKWVPQMDDYEGNLPNTSWYTYAIGDDKKEEGSSKETPSIDEYQIGSNGTLFSPHGGLRISSEDLAKVMQMIIDRGEIGGKRFLSKDIIEEMERSYWNYEGSNGDTMDGFMCNYGMSVHHLRGKELREGLKFIEGYMGHSGEAYGMLSGMYYEPNSKNGWIYYITGTGKPLNEVSGNDSAFSIWEEKIIKLTFDCIFKNSLEEKVN